jgi:putative peptidoglycan lipid II flippase
MTDRGAPEAASSPSEVASSPTSETRQPEVPAGHEGLLDAAAHPRRLLWTTVLVTGVYGLGAALGLARDVFIARYFGASPATDAFLVAWTIPETVTPVLAEGVLVYLLVPIMSRDLELGGTVQRILDRTLLPTVVALAALTGLVALLAPVIVAVLGPGLAAPDLAVRCTQVAALTVLFLGLSGYIGATLRTTGSFLLPTWVYAAYNVGIVGMMIIFHEELGVYSAAVGLAVGSAGMVAVLLPTFLKRVRLRTLRVRLDRRLLAWLGMCVPIVAYTVGRQAQVWVERSLGSVLDPGAISHLNYAEKVAQIPVTVAGLVVAVAMPSLARHAAAQRTADFRKAIERSLRLGMSLLVPATVALVVLAPQLIDVLFVRGAFTHEDAATTAEVMRVYSLGLLGQLVVINASAYFWSDGRRTWYPAMAMLAGLATTVVISWAALRSWNAAGIALGNAIGICVAAILMLTGVRRRVVDIAMRRLFTAMGLFFLASAAAGAVAWLSLRLWGHDLSDLAQVLLGGLVLVAVYTVMAWFLRIEEIQAAVTMVGNLIRCRSGLGGSDDDVNCAQSADASSSQGVARRADAP